MILRIWQRDKITTCVNIFGLSVGLAVSLVILLYVLNERNYDRFHENADRLYRVITQNKQTGNYLAQSPVNLGHKLKNEFSEIENTASVFKAGFLLKKGDSFIREKNFLFANPEFLEMFTFPLLKGDPQTALQEPDAIVITEEMAQKYFPNSEPVGQSIFVFSQNAKPDSKKERAYELKVTGVLKNIPAQSQLQMNFLLPERSVVWAFRANNVNLLRPFRSNSVHTFVLLKPGTNPEAIESRFPDFIERNTNEYNEYPFDFFLQPLTDVHLYWIPVNLQLEMQGNPRKVVFLSIIAFFIILIAVINYIILTTAQSAKRFKEIGLRKVVGAHRNDFIKQMLFESALFAFFSLPFAVILIEIMLPKVNHLLNVNLSANYLQNVWLILGMFGITLLVGALAGAYVVYYFLKFDPVDILKNQKSGSGKNGYFRNALIAVQMIIFIGLIICSITIKEQTEFMQDNATLGFEKENVISVLINDVPARSKYKILRDDLKKHPAIEYVTASMAYPPAFNSTLWGCRLATDPANGNKFWSSRTAVTKDEITDFDVIMEKNLIDYDYIEAMGIEMIEGESFSEEKPISRSDAYKYVLVNEAYVKMNEIENPVGKQITEYGDQYTIVGVMKDFHTRSLYDKIEPLLLFRSTKYSRQIIVKAKDGQLAEALAVVREKWSQFNPDTQFEYWILEDTIDRMYRTEKNFRDVVSYFTLFAILIACSGLFGLSLFLAEQRTKEIGIRKVLGASLPQLLNLLLREFCLVVLISSVIAAPIAYFTMQQWLEDFAYRIEMGWWMFALAGGLALAIALLTVSWQALRAATANPVEALRYE